jgi:hypothetical protein
LEGSHLDLKSDQTEYEIGNLAPGKYTVNLMSPLERFPDGGESAMTNRRLAVSFITLEEGDVERLDFTPDLADPAANNPPRATPKVPPKVTPKPTPK